MATWPAKINYATGDVLTAAQMNDIGGELNDLYTVAGKAAGVNAILNGDFGIWQRGTTFTSPVNGAYTADRWKLAFDGTGTCTISQQTFTPGTAPVAGYEGTYFLRHLITAAGTTSFTQVFQPIEDVRTFAGQTVTFSFWAKADTSRSSFIYAEQNFGSGGSATVQYLSMGSASLTTSWQRFSFTVALSSIAGKTIGTGSSLNFYIRNSTTLGATLDIWGVQLEAGSTATPFQTATGTIGGELALCQRYYRKSYPQANVVPTNGVGNGLIVSPTNATIANGDNYMSVNFPPMRAAPTVTIYPYTTATNTARVSNGNGTDLAAGSGTVILTGDSGFYLKNNSGGNISSSLGVILFHYSADAEL